MSQPTAVNPQITDAVTQANVKVLGEAPAMALGALYHSLGHSVGILFENAVAAQQQQAVMAVAAVTQGIVQIYSIDTAAAAGATAKAGTSADALQAQAQKARATLASTVASPASDLNAQIEQALKLSNEAVLGRAADVAYAVRTSADAFAAALHAVADASNEDLMRTLKLAATAACLEGMLRNPQQAAEYETVLQTIKQLA